MYTIIHTQNTWDISTLETYYLNFIASQINPQKSLKCSGFVKTLTAVVQLRKCMKQYHLRHWNKMRWTRWGSVGRVRGCGSSSWDNYTSQMKRIISEY